MVREKGLHCLPPPLIHISCYQRRRQVTTCSKEEESLPRPQLEEEEQEEGEGGPGGSEPERSRGEEEAEQGGRRLLPRPEETTKGEYEELPCANCASTSGAFLSHTFQDSEDSQFFFHHMRRTDRHTHTSSQKESSGGCRPV